MKNKHLTIANILLLGIFGFICLLTLYEWSFLPVLPDETSYLYISSRFLVDGGRTQFWPLCLNERTVSLPLLLFPQAIILSAWNSISDPYMLRLISITFNLSALFFYWKLILKNCNGKKYLYTFVFIIVNSFLFINLMPVALVAHRAEYLWALFFVYSLYLININKGFLIYIVFIYLFTLLCFIHPKYLYFFPFILIIIILSRINIVTKLILLSILVLFTYYLTRLNILQFLTCSNLPEMSAVNKSFNISIVDLLHNSNNSLHELIYNFSPFRWNLLVQRASFSASYASQTSFLPSLAVNNTYLAMKILNYIFYVTSISLIILYFLTIFLTFFISIKYIYLKNYKVSFKFIRILILGLCLLLHVGLNKAQAFYDSTSWLLIFALYSFFFLTNLNFSINVISKVLYKKLIIISILILSVSLLVLNLYYINRYIYKPFIDNKQENGIGLFNNNPTQNALEINSVAKSCGVNIHSDKLITDDYAYFLIQPSPVTAPLTWLWYGFNLKNKYSSDQEMYSFLWNQTEKFAINNSYKAVMANCPSIAIGFDNKKLFKSSDKSWNESICCIKF